MLYTVVYARAYVGACACGWEGTEREKCYRQAMPHLMCSSHVQI